MTIHKLSSLGAFGTNCYIVETDNKSAILIDAPCQPKHILSAVNNLGLTLKVILLTHGHCDHIEALNDLVNATGCKVYIHKADIGMLNDKMLSLAGYFGTPFTKFEGALTLTNGDTVTVDEAEFKVISTPGHTAGSVCYVIDDVIFSGDTLFYNSIGRTDFPGGDYKTIISSIALLKNLGRNYIVHPGHERSTDLYFELETNPFLDALR
ncbi:MAG: MBL fold metallo-hydrolase [Oscillospiraceae bacterium]|nr:MBL fold metallo-hydrolase [Oscillospiraceae bacterium]